MKTRPVTVPCVGALLSLALHLLLMTPVLIGLGSSTKRTHIDLSEIGKPADDANPSSSMTVSFIESPDAGSEADSAQLNERLAANPPLNSAPLSMPTPTYKLPPAEEDNDQVRSNPSGSGQFDPGRQLLFGRYIGQMTARVERAWIRPRTPISDAAFFACRVRVTQDRSGVVQEIELVTCNGTPRWQTSLVQAIQSASPLPAPPDAAVFKSEVLLDLQSATFTEGASTEGFEAGETVATLGKSTER